MNYMSDSRPKTIFCDIDGTLCEHNVPSLTSNPDYKLKILPGTVEKLLEWDKKGYLIILTTGRKESLRDVTIKQLQNAGIFYDKLIMGIGGGVRVLINDKKNNGQITAISYNMDRNQGIKDIDL